jgi:hypothetical protein
MKPQLVLIAALGLLTSCDQPKITVPEKQSIGSKTKLIIANEGDTLHMRGFILIFGVCHSLKCLMLT